ncbi:MAG: GyrI-like domain-containing protein [Armatimonas sp.]
MIKIGDFARLGQVTVPTLRFYAEVGLLKPVSVDETSGYRYYSLSQLPRLNRIIALKDLGFTLQQIEQVLKSDLTTDRLRGMLTLKQAEVEQLLATEQNRLSRIEARLRQIEQEDRMSEFDVAVKTVPAMLIAACKTTIPTNDQASEYLGRAFDEVFCQINTHGARPVGPCGAIWHQGSEVLENEVAEVIVPIDHKFPETERVQVYEVPTQPVAAVVHQGGYDNLPLMHKALLQWMEANGYEAAGSYREIYHSPPDAEVPVLEVQYPV